MFYKIYGSNKFVGELIAKSHLVEDGDFPVETASFFKSLEDALYILQELTPKYRNWIPVFRKTNCAVFTYHGTEDVMVEVYGDKVAIHDLEV